jgi:recombination associated protein RdgC
MFPRNLSLFRFSESPCDDIPAALAKHRVREPGPLEMATAGFASPYGLADDRFTVHSGHYIGFVFVVSERLLPASAINDALAKKVQKIAEDESLKVGSRERKRLREDLLTEMLPHAPVRSRRVFGWIDDRAGWLIVDTASRKTAENALSALREAFGSFPAVPLLAHEEPRVLLTDWLANGELPRKLTLGDQCELRDMSGAAGSVVRCRRQDLDAEEVREHLRNGKQAVSIGLVFEERLSFVLSDSLAVTGLRALDIVVDGTTVAESSAMQVECDFALATLEVANLLAFLQDTFKIGRPGED